MRLRTKIKNFIRFVLYNSIKFFITVFLISRGILIFSDNSIFKQLKNTDLLPFVDSMGCLYFISIFLLSILIIAFNHKSISTKMIIKKGNHFLTFLNYGIVFLAYIKLGINYPFFVYCIETFIIYLAIKYILYIQIKYPVAPENFVDSLLLSDRPISGESLLTAAQKKALTQLRTVIDRLKIEESLNIALIGEWGQGKTTITEALIQGYQSKESLYTFFILKINISAVNKTSDLIKYVENYFISLFNLYSISFFEKQTISFLSSLSKAAEENILNISEIASSVFCDLEVEKQVFSAQILELLKVSGRKNIIFIIDDFDRSELKEKIKPVLVEFSSINGIISIISMDESHNKKNTEVKIDNNENEGEKKANNIEIKHYDEIDKYIHLRIRIEKESHIEYENTIREILIKSYNRLDISLQLNQDVEYVEFPLIENGPSFFDKLENLRINIVRGNRTSSGNFKIISDFLFENMKGNRYTFGYALETIANEYILRSKELDPLHFKDKPLDKMNMEDAQASFHWISHIIAKDDNFKWINSFYQNAFQLLNCLVEIKNAISIADKLLGKTTINSVESLHKEYLKIKYNFDVHEDFEDTSKYFIRLIISETDDKKIIENFNQGNYEQAKSIVKEKINMALNFYCPISKLQQFLEYINGIQNNLRSFKMQIREAFLLNENYLDFILNDESRFIKEDAFLKHLKESDPDLKDLPVNNISLGDYIYRMIIFVIILDSGRRKIKAKNNKVRMIRYIISGKIYYILIWRDLDNNTKYMILDGIGTILTPKVLSPDINQIINEVMK